MNDEEIILGLFFADEDNLVFENVKCQENFSEDTKNNLKMLSFKFLGPVFLTAATVIEKNWVIESIESSLSLSDTEVNSANVIQSFFALNSSMVTLDGNTNLFTLIGTPFTEDIKLIHDEISEYIHPSILQGKIVNENLLGSRFNFDRFIRNELSRGLNLIEYSLGASRKVYWEERQQYYCVGVIERKNAEDLRVSNLYTFDKYDPLRKKYLDFIPSYYVLSILPDYYEHLISETLKLYDKKGVNPNIRLIKLSNENKKVVYLEEYVIENSITKSYGVVLVQQSENTEQNHNLSYYRKTLRSILERKKNLSDAIKTINPYFEDVRWGAILDKELNQIADILDNSDDFEMEV
jgi:hypothetical protein